MYFIGDPSWVVNEQLKWPPDLLETDTVIVQLDRRGERGFNSRESIRVALVHAQFDRMVILFGRNQLEDYEQTNPSWHKLIEQTNVQFVQSASTDPLIDRIDSSVISI